MKQSYITLAQLNTHIQQIFQSVYQDAIWIVAEIAELKRASSGHVYVDLIEKNGQRIIAKMQAVIWNYQVTTIQQKFGTDTFRLLKKGNKVLVKAVVDFHAVYGLKLKIIDLDAAVTIGELAKKRLEILNRLQTEGLLGYNQEHTTLPTVLQRIAVISSATAAGYRDFTNHIDQNPYQYKVKYQLFPAAMQGDKVEKEVTKQLHQINQRLDKFDAIVIIRGGGSQLDLDGFNNYEICKAIADSQLPVITGIGHQQDETLVDLIAYTALKTPTAVAEFVLNSFLNFEQHILVAKEKIIQSATTRCQEEWYSIAQWTQRLQTSTQHYLSKEKERLNHQQQIIIQKTTDRLQKEYTQLAYLQRIVKLLDVNNLLSRGFSIVKQQGKLVTDANQIQAKTPLDIQLATGTIKATIKE